MIEVRNVLLAVLLSFGSLLPTNDAKSALSSETSELWNWYLVEPSGFVGGINVYRFGVAELNIEGQNFSAKLNEPDLSRRIQSVSGEILPNGDVRANLKGVHDYQDAEYIGNFTQYQEDGCLSKQIILKTKIADGSVFVLSYYDQHCMNKVDPEFVDP